MSFKYLISIIFVLHSISLSAHETVSSTGPYADNNLFAKILTKKLDAKIVANKQRNKH